MSVLKSLAQNIMDLYYQQYKSEEDFFELYHFKYLAAVSYASMLQDEYEKSYVKNLQEFGMGTADINPDWFVSYPVDVKPDEEGISQFFAVLPCKPFQFKFDKSAHGIKDIIALNSKCKEFIRSSFEARWQLKLLPTSPEIYWYSLSDKIRFEHVSCGLSKAIVVFIPSIASLDDNTPVPEGMEANIITATLNLMLNAKNGQVIDMSDDGNPNKNLQTEINNLFTKLRGQG